MNTVGIDLHRRRSVLSVIDGEVHRPVRKLGEHEAPFAYAREIGCDSIIPDALLRRSADKVLRGDIQNLADSLSEGDRPLSGSRIREVVYGVSSLYQFAQQRELASHNPKVGVRLPAPDETVRDFVVEPSTFAAMLKALEEPTKAEREKGKVRTKQQALRDQVPYALASPPAQADVEDGWLSSTQAFVLPSARSPQ